MRVLFCQTVRYLPEDRGGGLTNTDALCHAIRAHGGEAAVLCAKSGRLLRWPVLRRGSQPDYQVFRSRDPVDAVAETCRLFEPDIAVVQFADAPRLVERLSHLGVPAVVYQHDIFAAAYEKPGAAGYLACSSVVADAMPRDLGAPVEVVPNLIDPDRFRVASTRRKVVLINPIPRKGVEIAFALAALRPDLSFQLVEAWHLRGRVRDYLQTRAAHHGNVSLLPAVDDMREIYQHARLILAPSLGLEAWGRVVSEAQVSGIPALVSDSGGLLAALGEGGIAVSRHAPIKDWSAALDALLDPAAYEKYVAAALAHAQRPEFQPGAIFERFMNLLEQCRR